MTSSHQRKEQKWWVLLLGQGGWLSLGCEMSMFYFFSHLPDGCRGSNKDLQGVLGTAEPEGGENLGPCINTWRRVSPSAD